MERVPACATEFRTVPESDYGGDNVFNGVEELGRLDHVVCRPRIDYEFVVCRVIAHHRDKGFCITVLIVLNRKTGESNAGCVGRNRIIRSWPIPGTRETSFVDSAVFGCVAECQVFLAVGFIVSLLVVPRSPRRVWWWGMCRLCD